MSLKSFSLTCFFFVSLALIGCESQRYKPADWRSMDNSTLTDRGAVSAVTNNETENYKETENLDRPEPTNWMELSGTGGEAVTDGSWSDQFASKRRHQHALAIRNEFAQSQFGYKFAQPAKPI